MKRLLNLSAILLVLGMLSACAQLATVPQTPQQTINEAKETVLAVKRTINQNLSDGFWSASKAESALNQVEALERDVKAAEVLLAAGNGVQAGNQAAAARSALRALRTQVEKK